MHFTTIDTIASRIVYHFPVHQRANPLRHPISFLLSQDEGSDSASKNQPELDPSGPQQKNQRNSDSVSSEGGVTNGSAASAAITQGGGSISVAAAAAIAGGGGAVAFHHGQELELAGLACVVKMYDFREGGVKLNDTVEFVGVLGYDQPISPQEEDSLMGEEAEQVPSSPFQGLEDFSRKVPPPSLAPRLHCICENIFYCLLFIPHFFKYYTVIGLISW